MDILDTILKFAGKGGKSTNPGQRLFSADKRPTLDNLAETKPARKAEAQRMLEPIANILSMLVPGGLGAQLATYSPDAEAAIRWQGSPNFIRGTKFDMSKLGTGEGAQVYGRGHYVAESPAVAERYRESLAIRKLMNKYAQEFDPADTYYLDSRLFTDKDVGLNSPEKKFLQALQQSDFLGYDTPARAMVAASRSDARTAYDLGQELEASLGKLGHLYKVDIPDEAIARMINISGSYGDQTAEVKKLITKAAEIKQKQTGIKHEFPADYNAREILRDLGEQRLNEAGIPGATYLDQGSRRGGGTTNNVLFNDDLARIIERNGKPTGAKPWLPGEYDYVEPTEARKDEAVQNILKFIAEQGVKL